MDDNQKQNWWPDLNGTSHPQDSASRPPFSDTSESASSGTGGTNGSDNTNGTGGNPESASHHTDGSTYGSPQGSGFGSSQGGQPDYGSSPAGQPDYGSSQTGQSDYGSSQTGQPDYSSSQTGNTGYGYGSDPYPNSGSYGGSQNGNSGGYGTPPYHQSNGFQGNYNYGGQNYQPAFRTSSGFSTASLVMGIISLLLVCCGFSYVFGALGIIFAILSRKGRRMDSQARFGLGLSIAGSVIGLIVLIVVLVGNSTYISIMQQYDQYYGNGGYGDGNRHYSDDDYDDYYDYFDDFGLDDYLNDPQWEGYSTLPFGQEPL